MSSEVAQTPTLPLNKEGILRSSSAPRSSGFHLYIYIVSIVSKRTEGYLYEFVLSGCLRENLLLPIHLYCRWYTWSSSSSTFFKNINLSSQAKGFVALSTSYWILLIFS